jgi:hypothetical protein
VSNRRKARPKRVLARAELVARMERAAAGSTFRAFNVSSLAVEDRLAQRHLDDLSRLRYAAEILDGLRGAERDAWDAHLDALARQDYLAAQVAAAEIRALADTAHRAGRWTDVDHTALMAFAFDCASYAPLRERYARELAGALRDHAEPRNRATAHKGRNACKWVASRTFRR